MCHQKIGKMDSNVKGISFQNDRNGKRRYVRFDLNRFEKQLQPVLDKLGVVEPPLGWEDALTPEDFVIEAKKIIRQKFDETGKIR